MGEIHLTHFLLRPKPKLTEQALIASLQEKSQSAFKHLVESYQHQVYNTCLGLLQNSEEAEEIAQDVFIEVYKSIDSFRGDSKLSTWLYRVATTKSLERIRKLKAKKRFAFLKSIGGSKEDEEVQPATFLHPGVQMEQKEHAQALFAAINLLPDNQRVAFTLVKVEGLPYQEVGEVMSLSLSSIESLMFRARKNLQKLLENYYEKNMRA